MEDQAEPPLRNSWMKSNPLKTNRHAYHFRTPGRIVQPGYAGRPPQSACHQYDRESFHTGPDAAIRRDKSVICFIDKPVEKVQLAAVRNAPHNIHFIASPGERVQLSVIRSRPAYIGFISNPTEKAQLTAVERRAECISLISKPAVKVQLMADLKDPAHIASIKEPARRYNWRRSRRTLNTSATLNHLR